MSEQFILSFLAGLGIAYLCSLIFDAVYFLMEKLEK